MWKGGISSWINYRFPPLQRSSVRPELQWGVGAREILEVRKTQIERICRKYSVERLRLFGSALRDDWDPVTSDFDFLAEFGEPRGMNAFDQLMGFILDLQALLGRNVDIVDWNAAKNPFFRRHAESQAREIYAS